jgi:hypothetical protein
MIFMTQFGPVVIDRAGDRGYVEWGDYFEGGVLRLTLKDGVWTIEQIAYSIS